MKTGVVASIAGLAAFTILAAGIAIVVIYNIDPEKGNAHFFS